MGNCNPNHMKNYFFIGILILLFSCNGNIGDNSSKKLSNKTDTIIKSKVITEEFSGSARKVTRYFEVIKGKTSSYSCVFYEKADYGKISIKLNIAYPKDNSNYLTRMAFLKRTLSSASIEYNLDSLSYIDIGNLADQDYLAIEVSKQYKRKFGNLNKIESYQSVSDFLKESQLAIDINKLLEPYNISVLAIFPEKVMFWKTKDVIKNIPKKDDTPDKILDCMMAIQLKKKNNYP